VRHRSRRPVTALDGRGGDEEQKCSQRYGDHAFSCSKRSRAARRRLTGERGQALVALRLLEDAQHAEAQKKLDEPGAEGNRVWDGVRARMDRVVDDLRREDDSASDRL
jgi:hypothetical protein